MALKKNAMSLLVGDTVRVRSSSYSSWEFAEGIITSTPEDPRDVQGSIFTPPLTSVYVYVHFTYLPNELAKERPDLLEPNISAGWREKDLELVSHKPAEPAISSLIRRNLP